MLENKTIVLTQREVIDVIEKYIKDKKGYDFDVISKSRVHFNTDKTYCLSELAFIELECVRLDFIEREYK
jgi:hypothetical protein